MSTIAARTSIHPLTRRTRDDTEHDLDDTTGQPEHGRSALNKGKAQPAQDPRLAKWRDEGAIVTVFLTNGTRLEGKVIAFDPQTILIDSGEHNLVYKTMILTISPPRKGGGMRGRRGPPPRGDFQPREGRPPARDGAPREPRVPVVRYKRRIPDR